MALYHDDHKGCSIAIETEEVPNQLLPTLSRVKSVVITCDGKNLEYTPPAAEGQDEAVMVKRAFAHAKIFIQGRR
jgi:hypothetical protein